MASKWLPSRVMVKWVLSPKQALAASWCLALLVTLAFALLSVRNHSPKTMMIGVLFQPFVALGVPVLFARIDLVRISLMINVSGLSLGILPFFAYLELASPSLLRLLVVLKIAIVATLLAASAARSFALTPD